MRQRKTVPTFSTKKCNFNKILSSKDSLKINKMSNISTIGLIISSDLKRQELIKRYSPINGIIKIPLYSLLLLFVCIFTSCKSQTSVTPTKEYHSLYYYNIMNILYDTDNSVSILYCDYSDWQESEPAYEDIHVLNFKNESDISDFINMYDSVYHSKDTEAFHHIMDEFNSLYEIECDTINNTYYIHRL